MTIAVINGDDWAFIILIVAVLIGYIVYKIAEYLNYKARLAQPFSAKALDEIDDEEEVGQP